MKKNLYIPAIILLLSAAAAFAQENKTITVYMAATWSPDSKNLTFTELRMTGDKPETRALSRFAIDTRLPMGTNLKWNPDSIIFNP
ncbi:MAG TPA: hypothetical protein VGC97_03410 [Pyrinomonadaceae bacterium]